MTLAPEDRKLALVFGVVLLIALGIAGYTVATDGGTGALPSSYSAGNSGTKAAFLLLEQTGYSPTRWRDDPAKLNEVPATATLILAEPEITEERDAEAVRGFVSRGGHLVVTGASGRVLFKRKYIGNGVPHFEWKSYKAAEPSELTWGIDEIVMAPQFYFNPSSGETPFQSEEERPIIRFPYGSGQVTWWASTDPMSNAAIREKGNAQLLFNSVGAAGGGPVLWDEYFHQGGRTVFDSIWGSPLRWALLEVAFIASLVCFTFSRRFGPTRASTATTRLAPMEFVETLASLYKRADAAHIAVEIVFERFRGLVQRRYSLRGDASPEQIATTVADHVGGVDANAVRTTLAEVEQAIADPQVAEKRGTELVRKLHEFGERMNLRTRRDDGNTH